MIERLPEQKAPTRLLSCIECGQIWLDPVERWRIYLTDDEPAEAVVYCSHCAEFEFGR
jgi:hypothetical protein